MTAAQKTALRARTFTYYEMLAFAQFYSEHRNENSPEQLLAAFLKWKQTENTETATNERLMLIEAAAVAYYGESLQDVRGKRRYRELVRCRQVIAYLTVKHASQNTIAGCLGGDRNNIQYSKTKCGILMETEPLLRKEVREIEARLAEPLAAIDKAQREKEQRIINDEKNDDATRHSDPSPQLPT
jgi:chromosomal replication initiation ATPase DnaA